jgi:hypothetical protein
MMERIELDGIDADLALITSFEAYCHTRDLRIAGEIRSPWSRQRRSA